MRIKDNLDPGLTFVNLKPPDKRISRIAGSEDLIREIAAAPDPEAVVELVAREDDKHVD